MTTEIAVINRLGVALAADSAVTISGFGQPKVFDSGDKLFELSHKHPVAIMVNGNLDFLGVPWEVIIKDFRGSCPGPLPRSIEGWSQAFLAFTAQHRAVCSSEVSNFSERFFGNHIETLKEKVFGRIRENLNTTAGSPVDPAVIEAWLLEEISEIEDELNNVSSLDSLTGISVDDIRPDFTQTMENVIAQQFGPGGISSDAEGRLKTILLRQLLADMNQDSRTGLVVCGFGGDDLFPSLHAVIIDGVVKDRLRYNQTHHVEITRDLNGVSGGITKELGTAISFAQTDVINRLLRGVDERVVEGTRRFIGESVGHALVTVFDQLSWSITGSDGAAVATKELATFLTGALPDLYNAAVESMGDEIEREFKLTISLMPKQELIELAEALVSITAVERKATRDAGTVGGPIDVALITRSEGFVWIKRKHHFSPELNPRYLSRVNGFGIGGEGK